MGRLSWLAACFVACTTLVARAQNTLELQFVPADRAQVAVWVERGDGTFLRTLALTHAVSIEGIGNRPGALQMNSGYRWPYGRREGVLPVWAHRRAAAPEAKQFKRIIFQERRSEGCASRTSNDQSVDDYYCLSFDQDSTDRDALDAVTCASVFSSDKGRFLRSADVDAKYAEPFEQEDGDDRLRALSLHSLYPPRRDVERCGGECGHDHADVAQFKEHALSVMPELDAISRATPPAERGVKWVFELPTTWPHEDDYTLFIEVNVEGDYNDAWNAERFPTPEKPMSGTACAEGGWDSWARNYGYPYRGQPSLVYALPFRLDQYADQTVATPAGYGALHGEDGDLRPLDDSISNDARAAPGSGADRLRKVDGARARLRVKQLDPCSTRDPPAECGIACTDSNDCGGLVCDRESGTCQGMCVATDPPGEVQELSVRRYPEQRSAHMWAVLEFRAPESERPIGSFEVRLRPEGGDWTQAFTHDAEQELLPVALDVCTDPERPSQNACTNMEPGHRISADLAGLKPSTRYEVSVAARDETCLALGATQIASFATPARSFTTVSPCFVASAAYGSPLASEVSVLRRVRDRYLAPHALGRALITAYYELGPRLARAVREHAWLRSLAQAMLRPVVSLAEWWSSA